MTKVFIDTNVFLDMYRANLQSDISTLMGFIFKNKKDIMTVFEFVKVMEAIAAQQPSINEIIPGDVYILNSRGVFTAVCRIGI